MKWSNGSLKAFYTCKNDDAKECSHCPVNGNSIVKNNEALQKYAGKLYRIVYDVSDKYARAHLSDDSAPKINVSVTKNARCVAEIDVDFGKFAARLRYGYEQALDEELTKVESGKFKK